MAERRDRHTVPVLISLVLALLASVLFLLAPVVKEETVITGPADPRGSSEAVVTRRNLTLVESEGPSAAVVLALPVALAAAPLLLRASPLARGSRFAAAVALVGWSVLGAASVGLFYLPSAVVMVYAALRPTRAA